MNHLIEMTRFYWLNIWEYQNTHFWWEYSRNCLIWNVFFYLGLKERVRVRSQERT